MEPDIIVKPIGDDSGVEDHIKPESDISSDEEDSELSGDEVIYTHTQTQNKTKKPKPDIQEEGRVANINEPSEQEIGNQIQIPTHANLLTIALMGRKGEVLSTQLPWPNESQLVKENCPRNMMVLYLDQ